MLSVTNVGCEKSNDSNTNTKLDPSVPIAVTGGKITGGYAKDTTVAVYKGIPYATAPVGDLRWKAPQDVEDWEAVKECTTWGTSAIHDVVDRIYY